MDVLDPAGLTAAVRRTAPGDELDRVEAALAVGADLARTADALIDQFVTEARQSGRSWTEIGARMGVSKQAARQRFATRQAGAEQDGAASKPRRGRRGKVTGAACSFCGKPRTTTLRLVAGPNVYICGECVALCNEILAEQLPAPGID